MILSNDNILPARKKFVWQKVGSKIIDYIIQHFLSFQKKIFCWKVFRNTAFL